MDRFKRLVGLLLACLMVLSCVPTQALAEEIGAAIAETEPSVPQAEPSVPQTEPAVTDTEPSIPEEESSVPEEENSVPEEESSVPVDETTDPEEEPVPDEPTFVTAATADDLAAALAKGEERICITADFQIDRTFYITYNVTIFTAEAHTLTRAADFAGDFFVIGEDAEGTAVESGEDIVLTLGDPRSEAEDLLVLDGNKDNMTVDVTGSVIFVCTAGRADLYANLTIQNFTKVGNVRTLEEQHGMSYTHRIGGAGLILANKAMANIYGGKYLNNTVNDIQAELGETDSISYQGGFVYSFGTLNIYGGTFEQNHAGRGGMLYCYRTANIYAATIKENTSSSMGGAIYMPNSTAAVLNLGGENELVEPGVLFQSNSSGDTGGAIYVRNKFTAKNTEFKENSSTSYGGAIAAFTPQMVLENVTFTENTSASHGGAIYMSGTNEKETVELTLTNTTFNTNSATKSGGAIYMSGTSRLYGTGNTFASNSANVSGGAIYCTASTLELGNTQFNTNSAKSYGGAIYCTGATVELNGVQMNSNSATTSGGAIALYESSTAILNNIDAESNSSATAGFLYIVESQLDLYNSHLMRNTSSTGVGGAIYFNTNAVANVYATTFEENTATTNGGAFCAAGAADVMIHSCTFQGNNATLGGGMYATGKAQVDIYNLTATGNSADKGGALYITTTGTVVNLAGFKVSGNTATTGGPIIWGNSTGAKLYIDKTKYIDLDCTDDWDDAYWAAAIYNSLKVYTSNLDVPGYTDYDGTEVTPEFELVSPNVTSAAQLERALNAGHSSICIAGDFAIDRTFYITRNVTIYSKEAHTLTRAADFAGDIFVVGEHADGTAVDSEEDVVLTLGDPQSQATDLLIIDGNKANMTVDVVGSVIFVCAAGRADLYSDLTIQNCKKVGNERTAQSRHDVSYPERIGGAGLILAKSAESNIYGGTYKNNEVNGVDEAGESATVSFQGGFAYNYGKLHVYGGTFQGNYANSGAVLFNYRTANIYAAEFNGNTASNLGGAIYMPNSTGAVLNLGQENELVEPGVLFQGNSAGDDGGAIYARNKLSISNTQFKENTAASYGGAIVGYTTVMTVDSSLFYKNTANYGGAIFLSGSNEKEALELTVKNTGFRENSSTKNGGAIYGEKSARIYGEALTFDANSGNYGGVVYVNGATVEINGAAMRNNSATYYGGAVAVYDDAKVTLNNIDTDGNSSARGGFAYGYKGELTIYNSHIYRSTSSGTGGAVAFYDDSVANIYATTFEENTATGGSGGAVCAYTTSDVMLHSCSFLRNSSSNNYGGAVFASGKTQLDIYNMVATGNSATHGGALYITASGTVVNLVGLTVSGNTVSTGGPIIWGNTTNAKLYIDKAKYTDSDATGALDSAYWKSAIANKLAVTEITGTVPKYLDYGNETYDHLADAVDVTSSQELEAAILAGHSNIRIVTSFEIDRTFFITKDTTIFTTASHTLTRAPGFGGDIFVVGEAADGTSCVRLGTDPTLTLGNPVSTKENLLIIDGNKDNMTVDVKGTVVFVCYGSQADFYSNVTVKNCYKVGNERTLAEGHTFSRPNRVGGPVAIVENGVLTIHGGSYLNNSVRDEAATTEEDDSGRDSTLGGVIYNYSTVWIYGGTFQGNHAARGGICYNYKVMKITQASFLENTASAAGGALYMPNSAAAHLRIGSETGSEQVIFSGNIAASSGGAIYSSYLCTLVVYGNTSFTQNQATNSEGGAICGYGQMTFRGTVFTGNTAGNRGGAVFASRSSENDDPRYVEFTNCQFTENQAASGGALGIYASSMNYAEGSLVTVTNTDFTKNTAVSNGGAVYCERQSAFTAENCNFTENSSGGEAGAIYVSSKSQAKLTGGAMTQNTAGGHGGAMSVRSSRLEVDGTSFSGNSSGNNGGAVYVSYISSYDINSTVIVANASFSENTSASYGGAFYVTRQTVEEKNDTRILHVTDSSFTGNAAEKSGGVVYLASKVEAYFADSAFTGNKALDAQGGVLYTAGATVIFERDAFTGNTAKTTGGAISLPGVAQVTLYESTAEENTSGSHGGFLYSEDATVNVYGGEMNRNQAGSHGGAMAMYGTAVTGIYDTSFTGNTASSNGGGLFIYTKNTKTVLHSNTFESNHADGFGGAMEMSNVSLVDIYDITGKNNSAANGGFIYETSAGTTVTLVGATISGNTATVGGPIIWGNTLNADLYIDKSKFVDLDVTGELDAAYWTSAIVNKLTVIETTGTVPAKPVYTPEPEETEKPPVQKKPVPVTDVFSLSEKSSDGYIDKVYDKLPKLDASSNFMSKNSIVYPNINGTNVTVDTFVYPEYGAADNMNVGQGLLIFQAMQYKQAHPEEEVHIDVASYRFSVEAAVNINRNSRYFGYMRNLYGMEYDQFGFVRISYLLVSAAKMGIHVNVIGHIDGYPISAADPNLSQYFVNYLGDPCDPAYVENGVIGDYMEFTKVQWSLDAKGGNDMMHTKMCAVSHYLDMNGQAHYNAVFSSSSNLDGIRSDAANGNWKLQTGSIVSDHAEIYRMTVNYLRIISRYGKYQEGVYEFQDTMSTLNTQQIKLILAGRENEIPADEQIVYLGSANDPVFELYFTPFGGGTLEWDETTNPYCKYLRKLYNSEGSIIFTWNAAEYSSSFALGRQMEDLIVEAFHKNRSPENKFYGVMDSFDGSRLADLVVGKDIGFVSVNNRPFGKVHNKDVQVSYVENGQRYYVTLHNSLNLHSGSMYYQSNFLLVIKETELKENGVFFTLAENSTQGIVEHSYGEEQVYYPNQTEHGYYYKECTQCGKQIILGTAHHAGEWTVHLESTNGNPGIQKKTCLICGDLLEAREYYASNAQESIAPYKQSVGKVFTAENSSHLRLSVTETPLTIEAKIHVPKTVTGRGGVIVGNYESVQDNQLNLEIYTEGKVRLYYINGYYYTSCVFDPDIRSDEPVHIAVTASGTTAKLYINGVLADTKTLELPMPESVEGLKVGSDNRTGNPQYFKGTIYSLSLFGDIRSADEILRDMIGVLPGADNLLYSEVYSQQAAGTMTALDTFGKTFGQGSSLAAEPINLGAPHTIEASVYVPKDLSGRAGVIVGNYDNGVRDQLSFEIYENGRVRLFYISRYQRFDYIFNTDVRTGEFVHLALTVDASTATLYVNGEKAEQIMLTVPFPIKLVNLRIGGDNRLDNTHYFKGQIASVHLFSDVRTAEEIRRDNAFVAGTTGGLLSSHYLSDERIINNITAPLGQTFSATTGIAAENRNNTAPATMEATIHVPKSITGRAGVILGNYGTSSPNQMNLEVYDGGRIRLFFMNNWVRGEYVFSTDIRSDEPVHIAVTVENKTAVLYVNGEEAERATLSAALPTELSGLRIGGDNRSGNIQYFKGTLYSVALFADARTAEEIRSDMTLQNTADKDLILSGVFVPYISKPLDGKTFSANDSLQVPTLEKTPLTIESWLRIPLSQKDRAGVLFGNYDNGAEDQLNIEIFEGGKVRLFYIANGVRYDHVFSTDIRSRQMVHLAITVDGDIATMYLNGNAVEKATLALPFANALSGFKVGGDNRVGNTQYFKGTVYSLTLFDHARTPAQIAQDLKGISSGEEGLLYDLTVSGTVCPSGNGLTGHVESDWITDMAPGNGVHGMYHTICTVCGTILSRKASAASDWEGTPVSYKELGKAFETHVEIIPVAESFSSVPLTYEVMFQLSPTFSNRGGVLFGNYTAEGKNVINLEIYNNGQPRFYYRSNYTAYTIQFTTDVRSDSKTHLALTIDGLTANLYVNGALVETAELTVATPDVREGYCIGGDARTSNYQNFKGTIHSVHLFSDVRTAEEIANDAVMVLCEDDSLIYEKYLGKYGEESESTSLAGKVIVNFGDSIFGNYQAPGDISSMIAEKTGATVYNVGFGGTHMSASGDELYDAFGMEKLADAIATGNFDLQDSYIASGNAPAAFSGYLNTLKAIDFSTVDIITISYGTNDFVNGKSLEDVKKAAQYSIETIRKAYPNVEIVLCTPTYRFWLDESGNFVEDSNTKVVGEIKLTDYIDLYKEIGTDYSVLVIDNYSDCGITAATRDLYFTGTDSTHPNEAGRQMIAEHMANELLETFG